MKKVLIAMFLIGVLVTFGCKTEDKEDKQMSSAPEMQIDANKSYYALLDTNMGKIKVKFFTKDAPKTVNNFVVLAKKGFYDGTIFHRVIKDFMIQGGDPEGTGMGGPGYQFEDEINPNKLVRGMLAMANRGPDTNGSQFFIVTAQATPWLDGKHTAFGEVVDGMDTVEKIEASQTGPQDRPVNEIKINKATIEEIR
jgi:cyclophilin family peptidyl-prolyl cis-trans isomerase